MQTLLLRLSYLLAVAVLPGCSQREPLDSNLVLVTTSSWSPDGHPGTALHQGGREVWPNVYTGTGKAYRAGTFVFAAPVPDGSTNSDGRPLYNTSISPQLFAIQSAGPPVLISQRILAETLSSEKQYSLRHVSQVEGGVRAEFEFWRDRDHEAQLTRIMRWTEIESWIAEAATAVPPTVTPLGTYRLLPEAPAHAK